MNAKLKTTERSQLLRDALLGSEDKKIRTDALTAAVRLADLDQVEDEKTAKAAAKSLLETHAFLVAEPGAPGRAGTTGAGRQGTGTGDDGGRAGKPMLGEDGKPTEEFRRGLGQFLLGVSGRSNSQEPTKDRGGRYAEKYLRGSRPPASYDLPGRRLIAVDAVWSGHLGPRRRTENE